ncbi:MAG TPA: nucleotidyltransferase domain-containing protein [Ktedonobacterales bacterium]|jgi:predicted nucleotidyltransferase
MSQKISQKRAQLYLREYPRLLQKVGKLRELVREQDPNVALLALFGSIARLEPRDLSDIDLVILLHEQRWLARDRRSRSLFVRLLGEAEDVPDEEQCGWPFTGVVGNPQGSDIDSEFLENIGAHGVLLYQQEGVALPPALAGLQPFDAWLKRVNALLAECERAIASKSLPGNIPA